MLDWFYDTPIVKAILEINKQPIIKKKADYKIKEEQKRIRSRNKRRAKNKLKKK